LVEEAVTRAEERRPILAVAHTPPFYRALSLMGRGRLRVFFDHGEPPPELFADRREREQIEQGRRRDAAGADQVVTISQFLRRTSVSPTAKVIRNGNDHLLKRRSNLGALAGTFRARSGLFDKRIVLNVTRFSRPSAATRAATASPEVRAALNASTGCCGRHRLRPPRQGRGRRPSVGESRGCTPRPTSTDLLVAAYLDADAYLNIAVGGLQPESPRHWPSGSSPCPRIAPPTRNSRFR
jgi:hypothetical protein